MFGVAVDAQIKIHIDVNSSSKPHNFFVVINIISFHFILVELWIEKNYGKNGGGGG